MSGYGEDDSKAADGVAGPAGGPRAAAAEGGLPPSSNRGVTVTVGVHWLALTFFTNPARAMFHLLEHFFGSSLENEMEWSEYFRPLGYGGRGYRSIWVGPEGVRLYGYPEYGQHCHLEIHGRVLEGFDLEHLRNYLFSLTKISFDWRCTRIDIPFDNCPFTPDLCNEMREAGNVRTRAHRDSWEWFENPEGDTLNIGTRQSGRMVRIYDRRGPTRLELQLRDKWAEEVCGVLTTSPTKYWLYECLGILRDFLDFVDASGSGGNISRAPLLPWWAEFILGVEKAELQVARSRQEVTRARTERHLKRLVQTLCVWRHGLGVSLDALADAALDELSAKHLARLKILKGG